MKIGEAILVERYSGVTVHSSWDRGSIDVEVRKVDTSSGETIIHFEFSRPGVEVSFAATLATAKNLLIDMRLAIELAEQGARARAAVEKATVTPTAPIETARCEPCGGAGQIFRAEIERLPGYSGTTCPACGGRGFVKVRAGR